MNAMIEETIERVEQLYTTLTGAKPPELNGQRAAFPPEIDPGVHIQEQLGRMVATLERLAPPIPMRPMWSPCAAAWTLDGDLVIALDVPGVAQEQVQVRVEPLQLTITGRRRAPSRIPAASDAPFGMFVRSFPLAIPVAPDQVSARLDKGVLTVRVHTTAKAQPSQISITS